VVKLPIPVSFDWNKANIDKSWKKHKVDYKETEQVFGNKPIKVLKDIRHSQTEDRFIAFGITNNKRKLYIVFTIREKRIRIISARDQSRKERKYYEKKN
jgi:uncharacterized protein